MTFDWREYLKIAEYLTTGKGTFSSEAAQRCAVSRAYYASFCCARNFAKNKLGYVPSYDTDDHWKVRVHLKKNGLGSIARKLNRLHLQRKDCDYKDSLLNVQKIHSSAIRMARSVLGTIK